MAGLLDLLQGNSSGGLLDLLRRSAMQQQLQNGLPSDQAQYDVPQPAPPQVTQSSPPQVASAMPPQASQPQPQPASGLLPSVNGLLALAAQPASLPQVAPQQNPQQSPLDNARWPAGPVGAPLNNAIQIGSGAGSYQMPQIGAPAPQSDPMQANARMPSLPQQPPAVIPAQSALPAPIAPASSTQPGFFDRVNSGLQSLGHGGSIIGALTGNFTDPTSIAKAQQAQVQNVTAKALLAKGIDPSVVAAAIAPGNTEMLKTLVTQIFGQSPHSQQMDKDGNVWDVNQQTGQRTIALAAKDDKFQHVETKDALGNSTSKIFNTKTGEFSTPPGDGGAASMPAFGQLLAKGITYDPNKSGDDYMAQFGPEVQAAAKAYINGDVMPTGNARMNAIATFAKSIAQKWGQDKGIPVNDSTYSGKRMMANQLASSSNSSMGGILSNGESSFSHLAEATKSMVDLGNSSHDYPFGAMIAHAQNYIGNKAGGSNTQAKILATVDNLGKYGAESTKFYAGTGGGVEERTAARKDVDPAVVSGEEMAAFAEKEKGLMLDRLNTKFQEIRNIYGDQEGNKIIAKHMPQIQQNINTIDANVAKLKGADPVTATGSTPLAVGQSANINGVTIKRVN